MRRSGVFRDEVIQYTTEGRPHIKAISVERRQCVEITNERFSSLVSYSNALNAVHEIVPQVGDSCRWHTLGAVVALVILKCSPVDECRPHASCTEHACSPRKYQTT